jgi:transglutaminase-like putative cysteine protease
VYGPHRSHLVATTLMRKMLRTCFTIAVAIVLPFTAFAASGDVSTTVSIGAVPAWVTEVPDASLRASAGTEKDAEIYLLFDQQANVAAAERYYRIVSELRNAEAVQDGSTVIVDYDPSYERLVVHRIDVIRGGVRSSRLSREYVQLLRRETSLEFQMLDGTVSATVVIRDVRPGDRIDVAYTVHGFNPALGGRFVDEYAGGWGYPVGRVRVRILSPLDRPLRFGAHAGASEPVQTTHGSSREYLWELADVPAVLGEERTPPWHLAAPWLQVSEFADWPEVGRWVRSLFPSAKLPAELEALVATWKERHATSEDRALAAVDWVQRNIRYVGIELGAGSYRPSPPATVVERRFGDCKDQVHLLCTLLRSMGIEAAPVLVSTWGRPLVAEMLPSPQPFDHVIARVVLSGRPVLVDPTLSSQRGSLVDRFLPDYGHGILAAAGQEGLLLLGPHQGISPEMEIVERMKAGGRGEPTLMTVETTARGGAADDLRWQFASMRIEEISTSYLNYYASRYPGIESAGEIATEDDESANVFRVTERYRVNEFWLEDDGGAFAELYADSIAARIPDSQTALRTAPLWVEFPYRVVQRMEIELPEDWPEDSGAETYENAAFTLRVDHAVAGRTAAISWDYRALVEEVPAAEVSNVQKAVRELDAALSFELTWGNEVAGGRASPVVLAVGIGILTISLAAAAFAYLRVARPGQGVAASMSPEQMPQLTAPPPSLMGSADERLRGIGGWLILVAVGLVARPILSVVAIAGMAPQLSAVAWRGLTDPSSAAYQAAGAPVLLFELAANIALAVASVLLTVFFFQRRRAFPRAFIAMLVAQALVYLADIAGTNLVPGDGPAWSASSIQLTVSTLVSSVVWILYLLRSRRVKLTFVR